MCILVCADLLADLQAGWLAGWLWCFGPQVRVACLTHLGRLSTGSTPELCGTKRLTGLAARAPVRHTVAWRPLDDGARRSRVPGAPSSPYWTRVVLLLRAWNCMLSHSEFFVLVFGVCRWLVGCRLAGWLVGCLKGIEATLWKGLHAGLQCR